MAEKTRNRVAARSKGKMTRQHIMEAALRLFYREGIGALTYRAVAKEADVNVSLTSYYFSDIPSLLTESFTYYVAKSDEQIKETWAAVESQLASLQKEQLNEPSVRSELANWLSDLATDYVVRQITERPEGIAVELACLYDIHMDSALREMALQQQVKLLKPFEQLFCSMGSLDPETDAQLCLSTLLRMEFEGLAEGGVANREKIRRQMGRIIQFTLRVD